ncbi:MAG: hypothetical protein ACYC10_15820 [Allorhizobium sp.]|nr:hypothetical protein [Rhizobiaceae bacterium]
MSSSIRRPCRPGFRRNVDSVYRFARLSLDHPGMRRFGHGSRVVRDRFGNLKPCGARLVDNVRVGQEPLRLLAPS